MKIWHRGFLAPDHESLIKRAKLKYQKLCSFKTGAVRKLVFEISEDDPAWPEIERLLERSHTFVMTEFSPEEIAEAEWSIVRTRHSIGYFVPKGEWWTPLYYSGLCRSCGTGWEQIADFRIPREPKLGKSVFSSFGSGFEVFAAPVVWETFRREGIRGWETRPLFIARTGQPVKGLQQLVVTEMAEPAVVEELCERQRYSRNECEACGRTWHAHYTRGMLPLRMAALRTDVDLQLTHEWFGNGLTARHEILASRKVVALALRERWRGIEFVPVRVV